jgi:hypothetical protein
MHSHNAWLRALTSQHCKTPNTKLPTRDIVPEGMVRVAVGVGAAPVASSALCPDSYY